MLDLCRVIFGIVVDLFRPRAALEAEILVLRQQIIVLRRGDLGCHFWPSTGWFWVGSASCFRRPARRSPSFGLIPLFAGIAQVSNVTGAGNRGLARAGQPWDGGPFLYAIYLATLVCPMSMPSLSSSP